MILVIIFTSLREYTKKIISRITCVMTFILIIALLFRFKDNPVAILFHMFQGYLFLHFIQKILEKRDKYKCILWYSICSGSINFLSLFLYGGFAKFLGNMISSKNSDLYSFAIIAIDSLFLGFYEFYNEKENIESKISFIKVYRSYNWVFFIIYSTFIFITYSTLTSLTILLFVGSICLMLKIFIFFSLLNKKGIEQIKDLIPQH